MYRILSTYCIEDCMKNERGRTTVGKTVHETRSHFFDQSLRELLLWGNLKSCISDKRKL